MKLQILMISFWATIISGCASIVGGSQSPQDLLGKAPYAQYQTEYDLQETFDCLNRWVSTKVPAGFRREVDSKAAEGHMFWKDGFGWVNWTYHFQTRDELNSLTVYRSANIAGMAGYLRVAAEECIKSPNSWPDSNY